MAKVTLLGSAASIANHENDSVYLLLESNSGLYLIDCGGSPSHKLAQMDADPGRMCGVLLTHDHSDHIYGLPLLSQTLMLLKWANKWSGTLEIWGLASTLETARKLLDVFELPERISINFNIVPAVEKQLVMETADLRVFSSPVQHSRPNVALRIEGKASGRVLVYSSDTEPCTAVERLAMGTDVLLHESTVMEAMRGHSTPYQAGQVAAAAQAKKLVLVHFDPSAKHLMAAEAAKSFGGPVEMGHDFMDFEL